MSNKKDKIQELKEKIKQRNKKQDEKEFEKTLDSEIFAVHNKGREFVILKIKYDYDSGEIKIVNEVELRQKVVGLQFPMEQKTLRFYYEQSRQENK